MKYEAPEKRSEAEITALLLRVDVKPEERIRAVLSALYYGESVAFSGDTLIEEFTKAKYDEKRSLKNLFETFYGMCRTAYRIDESISLLLAYQKDSPDRTLEIESTIEALKEYKSIFGKNKF